ncbi:methyltransferase family protein [Clostridium paraputrificum]|uniref:methyltransferase family protein n=1 Tax=Clostridium paraputrificum TaxID=29363 RepID=UPI003D3415A3
MEKINLVALILFILFISLYLGKLLLLYRKNKINANVLGKGKKNKKIKLIERLVKIATFLWGFAWVIESILGDKIDEYIPYLYTNAIVRWIGIVIIFIGVIIFGVAAFSMRTSWRVGIDKNTKTELVTDGIYRYSRNPAFLGFDTMFTGIFIVFPNLITLGTMIISMISIHLLILQEEKHLIESFGDGYRIYKGNTSRYI